MKMGKPADFKDVLRVVMHCSLAESFYSGLVVNRMSLQSALCTAGNPSLSFSGFLNPKRTTCKRNRLCTRITAYRPITKREHAGSFVIVVVYIW